MTSLCFDSYGVFVYFVFRLIFSSCRQPLFIYIRIRVMFKSVFDNTAWFAV